MRNALCLALLCCCLPFGARAELRALLIGVSDYLVLDADLKGPSEDVALMAEALAARGVSPAQMRALVSEDRGLPAGVYAGPPLRGSIDAAMAQLAVEAQPGDTVLFYFSGHGGQAPDQNGDEGGGPDEILLPADAAGWKGAIGAVENALVDDDLQLWAQGMLSRGVKVVGILDACHAATGFRALGATGAGAARGLTGAELGIPDEAAGGPVTDGVAAAELTGDFVFLYAAQSDQRAFEYPVGEAAGASGADPIWHGAFTLRLAQLLRQAPSASWAQLLAATSAEMMQGAVRQDPEAEGPLLAAQVFGQGQALARVALDGVALDGAAPDGVGTQAVLQAGALDGFGAGDLVGFYADPAGGEALGQARLTKVEARRAALDSAPPAGALWAERLAPAPPPPLALAAPLRADPADGLEYAEWERALSGRPVTSGPADLVPILTGGTVALAGADGALDAAGPGTTPRVRLEAGETAQDALARVLDKASHALRLRAVLAGLAGRSLTGQPPLEIAFDARPGTLTGQTCDDAGALAPADPAKGLAPCDALWLRVTNRAAGAMDVSVLYFDADFGVIPIWPRGGLSNRLQPGEGARAGLRIDPDALPGLEELLILAVPVEPGAARVDLTRLAEPATDRAAPGLDGPRFDGPRLDSPGLDAFAQLLDAGATNRGFSLRPATLTLTRQPVRVLAEGKETQR